MITEDPKNCGDTFSEDYCQKGLDLQWNFCFPDTPGYYYTKYPHQMDHFKREIQEYAARCKKTCGYCPGQTKPKPVVCGTPNRFGDGMCNDENNTPECK